MQHTPTRQRRATTKIDSGAQRRDKSATADNHGFLSRAEILELTGRHLRNSLEMDAPGKFPRSRVLGENRVGWPVQEYIAWAKARPVQVLMGDPGWVRSPAGRKPGRKAAAAKKK